MPFKIVVDNFFNQEKNN